MFECILVILLIIAIYFYWQYLLLFIAIFTILLVIRSIYHIKAKKEQELIRQKEYEELQEKRWQKEKEHQKRIDNCKKQFIEISEKMHKIEAKINNVLYKKRPLYDMPDIVFSTIRKNSSYKDISNFIVLDVETTGLHARNDNIIEISAVKFIDGEATEYMSTLINPRKEIPVEATLINNITNEMVKDSPIISNVVDSFSSFIKGYNIVGYNLEFDLNFLFVNNLDLFSEKRKFYDLLPICRKHISKDYIYNYKLNTVCEYYNIFRDDAHRSTSDALATGLLFVNIANEIKDTIYDV